MSTEMAYRVCHNDDLAVRFLFRRVKRSSLRPKIRKALFGAVIDEYVHAFGEKQRFEFLDPLCSKGTRNDNQVRERFEVFLAIKILVRF